MTTPENTHATDVQSPSPAQDRSALARIYLERHDLAWAPASVRRIRWLSIPAGAAPLGLAIASAIVGWLHVEVVLTVGIYMLLGSLGVGYFVDRALLRPIVRGRMRRLAGGAVQLARLRSNPDGELVHVKGTIEAERTIESVLTPERRGVFRRTRLNVDGTRVVQEDGFDFWLVDETGERIRVEIGEARLVAPGPELPWRDVERADYLELLDRIPRTVVPTARLLTQSRSRMVHVGEILVEDGAVVHVIGFKSRVPDFTIAERLARETPMRTVLRSGSTLPLLIAPHH